MIFVEPLFVFAQITFVTMFVVRTLRKFSAAFFTRRSAMTKIGTGFIFSTILIMLVIPSSNFLFFLPTLLCFLFPIIFRHFFIRRLERLCHKGFSKMLDGIILEMYRGNSMRSALKASLHHLPQQLPPIVLKILEDGTLHHLSAASFLTKPVHKNLTELLKIEQLRVNQMERILNFRDHLSVQNDFRHKSGQVMLQTRIQATFILILYVLVFFFSLHQFPWRTIEVFAYVSSAMLAIGLWLLGFLTKKKQWKT